MWAALWNVFLLGVSLEKSGPAADSTLLQCILGSENYAHDFLRGSSGSSVCLYFIWQFIWSYFYFYSMNPENTVQ